MTGRMSHYVRLDLLVFGLFSSLLSLSRTAIYIPLLHTKDTFSTTLYTVPELSLLNIASSMLFWARWFNSLSIFVIAFYRRRMYAAYRLGNIDTGPSAPSVSYEERNGNNCAHTGMCHLFSHALGKDGLNLFFSEATISLSYSAPARDRGPLSNN